YWISSARWAPPGSRRSPGASSSPSGPRRWERELRREPFFDPPGRAPPGRPAGAPAPEAAAPPALAPAALVAGAEGATALPPAALAGALTPGLALAFGSRFDRWAFFSLFLLSFLCFALLFLP